MGAEGWIRARNALGPRRSPPARAEEGLTLVEVLLGVAILGIAISTLVGSLGTTVSVSSAIERRADVHAEARRLAELLRAYDTPYEIGTALETVEDRYLEVVGPALGDHFDAVDVDVQCGNAASGNVEFSLDDCAGASALQRIKVTVTAQGDQAVRGSITVVKRRAER